MACKSVGHLTQAFLALEERCINGITANRDRPRKPVENSIGLVTALNPYIGYAAATAIAVEAHATGRGVYELVLEHELLPEAELSRIPRPDVLAKPQGIIDRE